MEVWGFFSEKTLAFVTDGTLVFDAMDEVSESFDLTSNSSEFDDDVPSEWESTLISAETYADMMHMSKQGIFDQLTFEYGDNFPEDAAQYAIATIEQDWNENALESAKTYQDMMSMSHSAIYDQLISEYGDQFTPEQAQYAVDNLG